MTTYVARIKALILAHKRYSIAGLVVLLIGGGLIFHFVGAKDATATPDAKPEVIVGRVADLMSGNGSLSIVAEIRSVNEAKISAESGGRVTHVRASLGDFVSAGQILAEVENDSQRAAVLQAEGVLEAAKAANANTTVSLDSAQTSALNTLLSTYATYGSTVHDDIDVNFSNPESQTPVFNVQTSESQLKMQLVLNRGALTAVIKRHANIQNSLTGSSDLATELAKTESELRDLRSYLDTLIIVLNKGIPSSDVSSSNIATYLADATAGRTAVTSALSSVASAQSGLQVAANNTGESGGPSASSASLKQAQGAYNATVANLEKTIIRSPIAGSLNNFTIKLGDFLTPSQQVAVVSNNGALEAVAYVTEEDKSRVSVGQKITLEGGVTGTVTKIAPALDPVTRRIEVRIGLPANAAKVLTNGQSVRIELGKGVATAPTSGPLSIPIAALKIEAKRTIVFTVLDNKLVAKEITIGKLSGDSVQVTQGLTADTEIVADSRGLKEGDEVTVAD